MTRHPCKVPGLVPQPPPTRSDLRGVPHWPSLPSPTGEQKQKPCLKPGGSRRPGAHLTGFSQGSAKAGAMLRVDFCHLSDFPPHSSARVVQTPSGPGPCLPFQDSPAMHCLTPTFWKPSIALQVPYTFDHADLSIENVLPLPSLPMKCLNEVRYLLLQETS